MRKASKVFSNLLVIILVIGMVGAIAYVTNGFTSDVATFYVEYNGRSIMSDVSNVMLDSQRENRFDVRYTFNAYTKTISGYTVKIVPDVSHNNDFDFTVDSQIYRFGEEKDLTKGFDIKLCEDYFTLSGKFSVDSVLKKVYSDKEVVINPNDVNTEVDNFKIEIYSHNRESCISIGVKSKVDTIGVTLPERIYFWEEPDGTKKGY